MRTSKEGDSSCGVLTQKNPSSAWLVLTFYFAPILDHDSEQAKIKLLAKENHRKEIIIGHHPHPTQFSVHWISGSPLQPPYIVQVNSNDNINNLVQTLHLMVA